MERKFVHGLLRLVLAFAAWLPATAEEPEVEILQPARLRSLSDGQGNNWYFSSDKGGAVRVQSMISSGPSITINGTPLQAQPAMSTADGSEYVFPGRVGNIHLTQRARMDSDRGLMRFLYLVENRAKSSSKVEMVLSFTLSAPPKQIVDATGRPVEGAGKVSMGLGLLGEQGYLPAALLVTRYRRPGVQCEISNSGPRELRYHFTLTLAPGRSAGVLQYLAPRRGLNWEAAGAALRELYGAPRIADANLAPRFLALLNGQESVDPQATSLQPLATLEKLAQALGMKRDDEEHVALTRETQLSGRLVAGEVEVETRFGKTKLRFEEIAGIQGGGDIQRTPTVFLRNGEILTGKLQYGGCQLETAAGLKVDVDLNSVELVVCRTSEADRLSPGWLVTLHSGDRLAAALPESWALEAVTPWGPCRLTAAELKSLEAVLAPVPSLRLKLANGSHVAAMLKAAEWTLPHPRFAQVRFPTQAVVGLQPGATEAVAPAPVVESSPEESSELTSMRLETPPKAPRPALPKALLQSPAIEERLRRGERMVIGGVELTLEIWQAEKAAAAESSKPSATPPPAATAPPPAVDPPAAEPVEEPAKPSPYAELEGDDRLEARLAASEVVVRSGGKTLRLEAAKIVSLISQEGDATPGQYTFKISLTSGEEFTGALDQPVLAFKDDQRTWRVPVRLLRSYQVAAEAEPAAKNASATAP